LSFFGVPLLVSVSLPPHVPVPVQANLSLFFFLYEPTKALSELHRVLLPAGVW